MKTRLFIFPEMARAGGEFEPLTVDSSENPTFPPVVKVGADTKMSRKSRMRRAPVSGSDGRNPRGARGMWVSTPHQSDVPQVYTGRRRTLYRQIYSESKGRSSILRLRHGWADAKGGNADAISEYSMMRAWSDAFGFRIGAIYMDASEAKRTAMG